MAEESREQEIKKIWADNRFLYRILAAVVLIGVGLWVGRIIYADKAEDFGLNVFFSVINVAATVLILEELNRRRSERDSEKALKRQLVMDAASIVNDVANNAVHQLRRKGWLDGEDGLLKDADLERSNLEGADLSGANLEGAGLKEANLKGAELTHTNLQGADLGYLSMEAANLWDANLQGAELIDTDLQNAILIGVNLQNAILWNVNLREADLEDSNLQGANLENAIFNTATKLPDGKRWTSETDMRRFTDPNQPDFWRSDELASPAYRGNDEK